MTARAQDRARQERTRKEHARGKERRDREPGEHVEAPFGRKVQIDQQHDEEGSDDAAHDGACHELVGGLSVHLDASAALNEA